VLIIFLDRRYTLGNTKPGKNENDNQLKAEEYNKTVINA
jgi:hypothetical protein